MKKLIYLLFSFCLFAIHAPIVQAQATQTATGSASSDTEKAPTAAVPQGITTFDSLSAFVKAEGIVLPDSTMRRVLESFANNLSFAKRVLVSTKEIVEGKTLAEVAQKLNLPVDPADGSLSPYQTRVWYSWRKSLIGSLVDRSQGLEQAARNALNMRNTIRTKARTSMRDADIGDFLNQNEVNVTWEQAFDKYKGNYEDIISASMRGRGSVDSLFKIPK